MKSSAKSTSNKHHSRRQKKKAKEVNRNKVGIRKIHFPPLYFVALPYSYFYLQNCSPTGREQYLFFLGLG